MKDPLGQLRLRFAALQLVDDRARGQVHTGRDFSGNDVTVVVLTEQAAADPQLRRAFAEAVERRRRASASGEPTVHAADLAASPPWAAIRGTAGAALAGQLLAAVGEEPPPPADGSPSADMLADTSTPSMDVPPSVRPDPVPPVPHAPVPHPAAPYPPAPAHPAAPYPPAPAHPGQSHPGTSAQHAYYRPPAPQRAHPQAGPWVAVGVIVAVLVIGLCCAGAIGLL